MKIKIILSVLMAIGCITLKSQSIVSKDKPGYASKSHYTAPANGAFDGSINTAWNAGASAPQWVYVDLQDYYDISSMKLMPAQNPSGNTTHEILVSYDLVNWISVDKFTVFSADKTVIERNFNPNLKKVKGVKVLTISSPSWVAWYDIYVIGSNYVPEPDNKPNIEITNLRFENTKGENSLGTYQSGNLKFSVANIGKGEAKGVEVKLAETNYVQGLDFTSSKTIGDMPIGNKQEIMIPVKGTKDILDGTANFSLQLLEKNGFNSAKKTLYVSTKAMESLTEEIKMYVEGKINEWQQKGEFEKSTDYKIRVNETTRAKKIEEFQTAAVNEFKKLYAASVNFSELQLGSYDADNECFLLNSDQLGEFVVPVPIADAPVFKQTFSSLKFQNPDFYIKDDVFVLAHVEVVNLNSKKFIYDSKNKSTYAKTTIDYKFAEIEVDVEDKTAASSGNVQKSTNSISVGKSDVDINIPVSTVQKATTFVLIIGNEDYSSFQTGLNTEVNVDYALNDAKVFKEYCNKTLGIPEKQIKLLTNATFGQMSQGVSWLSNLAAVNSGNAELIFYYSGHGLPDELTKESYLMPVDISGSNVKQALKLSDVYSKLNEFPTKKVTVFLDACFSGGARNQGLVAMKGVKIKPVENSVAGNMIVFSSSTGEESSGVYRDKQHGYMTYFLLKKLQESKGDITYKSLADYIIDEVKKETALSGKNQTPQLNYSPSIEGLWPAWKIK